MHALIIPGFSEKEDGTYRSIEGYFRAVDISPVFVPISWRRTVLSDNVNQFNKTYAQYDPATTILFGFSLGSMIALVAAAKRSPAVLMLASIAPWFAEDVERRSASHKHLVGSRRLAEYQETSFNTLVTSITTRHTYIFVTDSEGKRWPSYLHRAKEAHQKVTGSTLIQVKHAGHSMASPEYSREIAKVISGLPLLKEPV